MAHTKAGGSAKNLRDSQPKFLGIKKTDGEQAAIGEVIVRQRGTKVMAGKNVGIGVDHTLFALKPGTVRYGSKRKIHFDGTKMVRKIVHVT